MVRREGDQRVVRLPRCLQGIQDASHLDVNLLTKGEEVGDTRAHVILSDVAPDTGFAPVHARLAFEGLAETLRHRHLIDRIALQVLAVGTVGIVRLWEMDRQMPGSTAACRLRIFLQQRDGAVSDACRVQPLDRPFIVAPHIEWLKAARPGKLANRRAA